MKLSDLSRVKKEVMAEFPDAKLEVRNGSKHHKLIVSSGDIETIVPISKGTAYGVREHRNMVAKLIRRLRGGPWN